MYRRWLVYRRRTCGLLPGLIVRLLANKCQECALQWCWTSLEREMKWTEAWSSRVVTLNSYDSSMMISSLTWSPSMGRPISAMRRSSSSFPASGSSSSFSSFCCSSGKKRTNEGRREEQDSVWVCRKNWQETRTFIHPSWRGSWWLQWREYWRIHRWLLCFLFVFLGGDFLFKWQHKKNEAHRCCFSVKTATPMWVFVDWLVSAGHEEEAEVSRQIQQQDWTGGSGWKKQKTIERPRSILFRENSYPRFCLSS